MAENKATTIGRFRYIEPTNMNLDLPDNAITFPYEDYSIGVKLEVSIPDRFSCGNPNGKTIMYSSNNGSLDFFGGTGGDKDKREQGFLTTKFTDISSNNIDRGNKECLGIESINISYQQWFYPIVNIRFVDVRGASLFMPQEKALQETVKNGNTNITQINSGSFFKAIFACPSPIFKLTVMGFYGKSVTFNLKMSSFQSEFDSESGNFIASVDFVGNMYGVYTEIPLQYIAIAPYLNMNYWEANKGGKFAFNEGSPMLTFPEFWRKVKEMSKEADKFAEGYRKEKTYSQNEIKKSKLISLKTQFEEVFDGWVNFVSDGKKTYFKRIESNSKDTVVPCGRVNSLSMYIKEFNDTFYEQLPFELFACDEDNVNVEFYQKKYGKYTVTNGAFYHYGTDTIATPTDAERNAYVIKESDYKDNSCTIYQFSTDFYDSIVSLIEKCNDIKKDNDIELQKELYIRAGNILGFKLSIGNIFKLLFSHLDAFINAYYETLNNISSADRPIEKFNITNNNSDIPDNIRKVPPFPLVYGKSGDDTDKTEVKWLEDLGVITDETILVNNILAASHNYFSAMTEAENTINQYSGEMGEDLNPSIDAMVPVTLFDILKNNGGNTPYSSVVDNQYDYCVEKLKTVFTLRCLYAMYMYNYDDSMSDYVAWAEALNVRKAFGPVLDKNLKDLIGISTIDSSVKNYEDYITKNKTALLSSISNTDKPFISSGAYSLIKDNDKTVLPLDYNLPRITRDVNSNTFDSDTYMYLNSENTNKNSFYILPQNSNYFSSLSRALVNNANSSKCEIDKKDILNFVEQFGLTYRNAWQSNLEEGWNIIVNGDFGWTDENKPTYSKITNIVEIKAEKGANKQDNWAFKPNTAASFSVKNYANPCPVGKLYERAWYGNFNNDSDVFSTDFYKCQNNNKAKAYCFLFSNFPIGKDEEIRKRNCGLIPYLFLLQEGAYYWRKANINEMNYQANQKLSEDAELVPLTINASNSIKFVSTTDNNFKTFQKWENVGGKTNATQTRIDRLIALFENFSESEFFNKIKDYLENIKNDTSDDKVIEIQSEYTEFLKNWYVVLDYTVRPDNKQIPEKINLTKLKNTYSKFLDNLSKLYGDEVVEDASDAKLRGNQLEVKNGIVNDRHLKISTYLILKDLYDKYFSNMSKNRFMLDTNESEFKKFLFIDSYYNDISDKLLVNSSVINDLIKGIVYNSSDAFNVPQRYEKGVSVYEFMSEICQKCFMTLLALPQRFNASSPNYLEDMFTPHTYKDLNDYENDGCYIGLYSYRPSQQLDIEGDMYAYKNDSFDIRNDFGETLPSALRSLETNEQGNFTAIPAFGVTYAKQNQSLFKRISLTTSNQQVTEQSIFATMDVAAKGNEGPRESTLYGQDLYRVFSSYAYQCTVEMMGNIQIMPLMYFQLNNISMWHGAYMVISVEHNISAGEMVTRFTGVRINRNSVPLVDADLIFMDNVTGDMIEVTGSSTNIIDDRTYAVDESTEPITDREDMIVRHIKKWEGGYADIPEDKGGCTMSGVTIATFRSFYGENKTCEDLRNISDSQWLNIFRNGFYKKGTIPEIRNDSTALLVIDTFYNMGIGHKKTIARLFDINTKNNNNYWQETVNAINNTDDETAFAKIWNWRKNRYNNIVAERPNQQKFLKGWMNRLESIKFRKNNPQTDLTA